MKTRKPQTTFTSLSLCAAIAMCALGCAAAPLPESAPARLPTPAPAQPPAAPRAQVDRTPAALSLSYEALKSSDFYQFFGLREVASMTLPGGGHVVELKPGGFRESIDIALDLDGADNVRTAHLGLARRWIGGAEQLNPLATDIAASFLSTFVGDRDRPQLRDLADALRSAHGTTNAVVQLRPGAAPPPQVSAKAQDFVRTFEGLESSFRETMHDLELTAQNANGSVPFFHLELKMGSRSSS